MKLSEFNIEIPDSLVANFPSETRDECKLMVCHKDTGKIEHRKFKDLIEYFEEGDAMVYNNTRVFPARLYGNKEKTGARIEVFLLRELNAKAKLWDVMVDPARKIRVGNKLYFGEGDLVAEVVDNTTSRGRTIRFLFEGESSELREIVEKIGNTPLPPYINRDVVEEDKENYQTIYAKETGAVAAPTAGLHFTKQLMKRLELQGVEESWVTLHIGLGTFSPVEVEDLSKHRMDSEYFIIPEDTCGIVNSSKLNKKRVCAVGTSSVRALESSVSANYQLKPISAWTDKFINPPYEFRIINSMVTNFHRPKSTLLMMVASFMGYEFMMEAYAEAIKKKYRFYSYGDAMLII